MSGAGARNVRRSTGRVSVRGRAVWGGTHRASRWSAYRSTRWTSIRRRATRRVVPRRRRVRQVVLAGRRRRSGRPTDGLLVSVLRGWRRTVRRPLLRRTSRGWWTCVRRPGLRVRTLHRVASSWRTSTRHRPLLLRLRRLLLLLLLLRRHNRGYGGFRRRRGCGRWRRCGLDDVRFRHNSRLRERRGGHNVFRNNRRARVRLRLFLVCFPFRFFKISRRDGVFDFVNIFRQHRVSVFHRQLERIQAFCDAF